MLSTAEALDAVLAATTAFPTEKIDASQAAGRVLRQVVSAERDQPPFDRVMMDGIAFAWADYEKGQRSFPIQGMQAAGDTVLTLDSGHWVDIATRAPWQMTRMNLNTFARHGVFEDSALARLVAERVRDREAIASARAMPYQLMVAYTQLDSGVPRVVGDAIQDAMEVAIENVPAIDGQMVVCPDVSGSMGSAITGYRHGSTSVVRCVDVAALFAAAIRTGPLPAK